MAHQIDMFPAPVFDHTLVGAVDESSGKASGWASFSPCGTYRYELGRVLDPANERTATCVLANPSKANAVDPDNTVTKLCEFARRWGCGRLVVVNARAYIATVPADMQRAAKAGIDVVGPDNEAAIRMAIGRALLGAAEHGQPPKGLLVLACGKEVGADRMTEIMRQVRFGGVPPMCLGTNQNGTPCHPLYLPYATPLVPFVWPPPAQAEDRR